MCIFAKLVQPNSKKQANNRPARPIRPGTSVQRRWPKLDMINVISFCFALVALIVLLSGYQVAHIKGFASVIRDSYSAWLGILIDALLLYFINWAIRNEDKERLVNQFASESNAFALDATKRLRKKGWLTDGRLCGIDLRHAQLSMANLSRSILQKVDLSYALMEKTILVEADFSGSNLTGVDLRKAECRWANFSNTNLRWANLEGAILDGANFDGADLRFAKLGKINSSTVSMEGALLSQNISEEEIELVQSSTALIRMSVDEFSIDFYGELFKANPVVKTLFISNIKSQASKFAQLFELLISSLNNMDKLLPALKSLGKRHVNYGVTDQHYKIVEAALINTLRKNLKHHFTPEREAAWGKTYSLVTMIMIDSAKGLL